MKSFEELESIVATLRSENGCPWDREQTHQSLKSNLLEETYEIIEAIENNDSAKISEELGDLLSVIMLQARIGQENGDFDIEQVLTKISEKLIERHPHIYGTRKVKTAEEVKENWERIKRKKRKNKGTLSNIPKTIPPMVKAMRIQEKVKSVGFDWDKKEEVIEKVYEEIKELKEELKLNDEKKTKQELGDLIFSVINMARFINIDPEEALESTNIKFINRFQYMEEKIAKDKKNLKEMSLNEMNKYWNSSKKIHG